MVPYNSKATCTQWIQPLKNVYDVLYDLRYKMSNFVICQLIIQEQTVVQSDIMNELLYMHYISALF